MMASAMSSSCMVSVLTAKGVVSRVPVSTSAVAGRPQLPKSAFLRGSAVLPRCGLTVRNQVRLRPKGVFAQEEKPEEPAAWSVKNDFPDEYVLFSSDVDEVAREIERLNRENEMLRKSLSYADDEDATPKPAARVLAEVQSAQTASVSRPNIDAVPPPVNVEDLRPPKQSEPFPVDGPAQDAVLSSFSDATVPSPTSVVHDSPKVAKTEKPRNIIFVTSEVAPWSKTGGLADVCGSLPIALAARGHRVMCVAPRYMNGTKQDQLYDCALDVNFRIKLPVFGGLHEVAFFHAIKDGVDWVFVDHPSYHRPGNPYGDSRGAFGDNQYRYTLLSMAACEAALQLPLVGGRYGEDVLFIANDWHASLVPVYVSAKYRPHNVFKNARTVLAIHNLSHQGVDPAVTFPYLGLPDNWYGSVEWVFPEWARAHALDKGEAVNLMKGAIVTADRILTVSKGYAWEICTIEGGWGLDGLLRGRSYKLSGITNGIDVDEWNPSTDKHTPAHFSVGDMAGKAICKRELQKELGLPQRPDVPLLCFIGRLDYQKGPDLLQQIMPELLKADVQFVMLGSGDKDIEKFMAWAEGEYRDKFRGWVGFSVPMAHRITAGSDILLMPSRFEPCGLNQLYAMRYGTVPVAHATGGLRDTIEDFNPFANGKTGSGTG
eukprot:jgi/Mesvir1/12936/Mv05952-RA.3